MACRKIKLIKQITEKERENEKKRESEGDWIDEKDWWGGDHNAKEATDEVGPNDRAEDCW